jgi:rSAM/selenodomain-associated transferase 2
MYGIPAADAVAAALLVLVIYLVWAIVGAFLLWQSEKDREAKQPLAQPGTISVVIPTLNEAEILPSTVQRAKRLTEVCEVIVADGGSKDATRSIAEQLGCRVLMSPRGQGCQLRRGAAEARGDVVLLLHPDTWLAVDAGQALLRCLRDPGVLGGACWKAFRERRLLMAGARLNCALRLWLFGRVQGDQAIFVRREALEAVGGVPDVPLMEDFILSGRLRKLGRLALAGTTVTASAKRFVRLGVWRTYFRMAYVTARYYLGASCSELQQIYERD